VWSDPKRAIETVAQWGAARDQSHRNTLLFRCYNYANSTTYSMAVRIFAVATGIVID
jgi:hypothetical protein